MAPFAAARMGLLLTTPQRFGCGHVSRLRWSVNTEGMPAF